MAEGPDPAGARDRAGTEPAEGAEHDALDVAEWVSELRRLYVEPTTRAEVQQEGAKALLRRRFHIGGPKRTAPPVESEAEPGQQLSPMKPAPVFVPGSPHHPSPGPVPPAPDTDVGPPVSDRTAIFPAAPVPEGETGPERDRANVSTSGASEDPEGTGGTEGPSSAAWLLSYLEATGPMAPGGPSEAGDLLDQAPDGGSEHLAEVVGHLEHAGEATADESDAGPNASTDVVAHAHVEGATGSATDPQPDSTPLLSAENEPSRSEVHATWPALDEQAADEVVHESDPLSGSVLPRSDSDAEPVHLSDPAAESVPADEPDPAQELESTVGQVTAGDSPDSEADIGADLEPEPVGQPDTATRSEWLGDAEPAETGAVGGGGPEPRLAEDALETPGLPDAVASDAESGSVDSARLAEQSERPEEAELEPAVVGEPEPDLEAQAAAHAEPEPEPAATLEPPTTRDSGTEPEPAHEPELPPLGWVRPPSEPPRDPRSGDPVAESAAEGAADHAATAQSPHHEEGSVAPLDETAGAGVPAATSHQVTVAWRGEDAMGYLELDGPSGGDPEDLIIVEPPSQLFASGRRRRPEHPPEPDTPVDVTPEEPDEVLVHEVPPVQAPTEPPPAARPTSGPGQGGLGRGVLLLVVLLVILAALVWFFLLRGSDPSSVGSSARDGVATVAAAINTAVDPGDLTT